MIELGLYEHFKGGLYEVLCVATDEEFTNEKYVIYKSKQDGKIWLRKLSNFNGYVTTPEGKHVARFEKVKE